ncbi:MAG: HEAT repeat domain-containing protein [Planctomycetota bacterium]|nr:HEAT repeat domain-containing protein [Planctomycetota bacterium]
MTGPEGQPAKPNPIGQSALRERAIEAVETLAKSTDAQTRANAVEAASYVPARLSDVIARGLRDASPGVRSVAAMAVGRTAMKDLAPQVTPLMADPSPTVRASAIFALAKCGVDVDRSPLARFLLEDPSAWVRRHTAFVLGELGDPSAIPLLRAGAAGSSLTPDQEKALHLQIAEAMVKLGDADALQVLRAALYPSRPEELEGTALAVQIIGQVRDRESIDPLIQLVEFKDRAGQQYPAEVRLGIAAALAGMGLPRGGYVADEYVASENPVLRAQAAFVYGEIADRASWGRLDELMNDADPRVRVAAAASVLRSARR